MRIKKLLVVGFALMSVGCGSASESQVTMNEEAKENVQIVADDVEKSTVSAEEITESVDFNDESANDAPVSYEFEGTTELWSFVNVLADKSKETNNVTVGGWNVVSKTGEIVDFGTKYVVKAGDYMVVYLPEANMPDYNITTWDSDYEQVEGIAEIIAEKSNCGIVKLSNIPDDALYVAIYADTYGIKRGYKTVFEIKPETAEDVDMWRKNPIVQAEDINWYLDDNGLKNDKTGELYDYESGQMISKYYQLEYSNGNVYTGGMPTSFYIIPFKGELDEFLKEKYLTEDRGYSSDIEEGSLYGVKYYHFDFLNVVPDRYKHTYVIWKTDEYIILTDFNYDADYADSLEKLMLDLGVFSEYTEDNTGKKVFTTEKGIYAPSLGIKITVECPHWNLQDYDPIDDKGHSYTKDDKVVDWIWGS